jgi:hypothetical protein
MLASISTGSLVLLILLHLSLHLGLLVLLLLGLQEQLIGLARLGLEVLVLSEKKLELDGGLIEKHTGDCGSKLLSVRCVDGLIDVVTNKVVPVITLQTFELADVNLWKLHHLRSHLLLHLLLLLLLHHNLLLRRLLTHLLLGRLLSHLLLAWLHAHLHVVLVVLTSHLAIVVVLPALVVVTLLVALVSTSWILKVSSSSSVTATASVLESLTTTVVLVSVILEVSLGWTVVTALHATWSTLIETWTVLLLDLIDQLRHVIDVFVPHSILSLVLSLPEVYFEWFHLFWEKSPDLIEKLDGLLSLLHTFV